MEIANPIYDVVFKYLMEDNKVAKIILSTLTDLDIIELEFLPQELSHFKVDDDKNYQNVILFSIYPSIDWISQPVLRKRWQLKTDHHRSTEFQIH